jgi:hypothetical protein
VIGEGRVCIYYLGVCGFERERTLTLELEFVSKLLDISTSDGLVRQIPPFLKIDHKLVEYVRFSSFFNLPS